MKSDFVVVITTQWRADALGEGENALCKAPGLAGLARVSTRYLQAFTPHPFGPMARAALLTGVPSPMNGVRDYYDPLTPGTRTWAHDFSALGYQTAFVGKWHLAPRDRRAPLVGEIHARQLVPPEYRGGFAHWEGFESGFLLNDPWLQGPGTEAARQLEGYQSDVLVDRALRWWKAAEGRGPRLLVVSLEAPHPPYDAPCPAGPVEYRLPANVPRGGEVETKARRELAGYVRHVQATADSIGRLWRGVGGEESPTGFCLTSVHGDMHGAHGLFRKGWPYDEAIRVPLWVRPPHQNVGETTGDLVSLLQLRSALAGWATGRGGLTPADVVGLGMPSVVRLAWQCPYAWRAARSAKRKFVETLAGEPLFFFDLEEDPGEETNLLGRSERRTEVAAWRQRLAQVAADFV